MLKINEKNLKNNHILKFNLNKNEIFEELSQLINNYAWLYSRKENGFGNVYFNRKISMYEKIFKEQSILNFVTQYNISHSKTCFNNNGIVEYENMSIF